MDLDKAEIFKGFERGGVRSFIVFNLYRITICGRNMTLFFQSVAGVPDIGIGTGAKNAATVEAVGVGGSDAIFLENKLHGFIAKTTSMILGSGGVNATTKGFGRGRAGFGDGSGEIVDDGTASGADGVDGEAFAINGDNRDDKNGNDEKEHGNKGQGKAEFDEGEAGLGGAAFHLGTP